MTSQITASLLLQRALGSSRTLTSSDSCALPAQKRCRTTRAGSR